MSSKVIFVFGSNTEGRHGKGAAKEALDYWGAKYGQAKGLQGNSFAIITKNLKVGFRSVTLQSIREQLITLHRITLQNKDCNFIVTAFGTKLAGFTTDEIKSLLEEFRWPENVYFNSKFFQIF